MTDDVLRDFFEQRVGPVKSAMVMYDDRGVHRGFGFVQFHSVFAQRIMDGMHGSYLKDKRITVNEARNARAR